LAQPEESGYVRREKEKRRKGEKEKRRKGEKERKKLHDIFRPI
jgi:hypothetical protein